MRPSREASRVLWLVMAVAVIVVAVALAERWVRHAGVQEAADRIATGLGADVELQVVGRPLLWHLARRELPAVAVVTDDLPVLNGDAALDRLRVDLSTVRLVGRDLERRITAESGRFHITLSNAQLLEMVTLPPYLVSFEIVPRGLRLQTLAGVAVDATVRLDATSLLVRPSGTVLRLLPQPSFRLPLPAWPYGASVEGYALHVGSLEAWGVLDPGALTFPAPAPWKWKAA